QRLKPCERRHYTRTMQLPGGSFALHLKRDKPASRPKFEDARQRPRFLKRRENGVVQDNARSGYAHVPESVTRTGSFMLPIDGSDALAHGFPKLVEVLPQHFGKFR